jgi:hypothetical protein
MMIETSPHDLQAQPLTRQRFPYAPKGDESGSIESALALAKGVLDQAAKDLRKFRASHEAIGRELYRDAYSWIVSNDLSWPYSFVNVCEALGLSTEVVRSELLADAQSGWYSHSRLVARKISTSFRGSLTSLFRRGVLPGAEKRAYAVEYPQLKSVPAGGRMQLRNS